MNLTKDLEKANQEALAILQEAEDKNEGVLKALDVIVTAKNQKLIDGILADVEQAKSDTQYLERMGYRILNADEKKFYTSLIGNVKQEITAEQIDILPTSIIDRTLEDVKENSRLLDLIEFAPADVQKWLVAQKTGVAVWGELTGDVSGELNATFEGLNVELAKLTAYLLVPKAIKDLALPFVDKYFTAILGEAMNDGLEKGFLIGTGVNEPIGIYKKTKEVESDSTHKNKTLAADLINFTPVGLKKAKKYLSNEGKRVLQNIALVCNPMDRYEYVDPSILDDMGNNISSLKLDIIESVNNPLGKAALVVPKKYVMGFSGLNVRTYDQTKALEDADVIIAKVYANGRATDDSIAYVFDVTKLEEYVQRVKMIEVTPEP